MKLTFPTSRPIRWLLTGGALLIAAMVIGTSITADYLRERALADSRRELENTALLLARHFDQQFDQLELIETSLADMVRSAGISSVADFDARMTSRDVHLTLRNKIEALVFVNGIGVVNSEGIQVASSNSWPVGVVNVADRGYFTMLKSQPDLTTVLSEPVVQRITGTWTTVLARRLSGPNGEFLGIVNGSIALSQFEQFFSSLTLGAGASIAMMHLDGNMLVRHPRVEDLIGRNFANEPGWQKLLSNTDGGSMLLVSAVDGAEKVVAVRKLGQFPLAVVTTRTVSAALADWREQTRLLIGAASLFAIIVASMVFLIVRQLSRDYRSAGENMALEKHRLDVALNNMTQGLLLLDASERILICNQRYVELYGLPADVVKPGCSFRELLEHRKAAGSFAGDADEVRAATLRRVATQKVTSEILEATDGRSIQVVTRPLADGGWVATHEDITERMQSDERIAHLAHYDALTDLPNRVLFGNVMQRSLNASNGSATSVALFKIDLDAFQEINDAAGIPIGDEVLRAVSRRIRDLAARLDGYAGRMGGDEFALFAVAASTAELQTIAADLCRELARPLLIGDREIAIEACVGAATYPFSAPLDVATQKQSEISELMTRAAIALHAAKRVARGTCRLYSADLDDRQRDQMELRHSLRRAIGDHQFKLHYHPLVDLASGRIVGAEALVRWDHPTLGLQRPDIFIALAERSGLIVPLGAWVLQEAMRQSQEWRGQGIDVPKIAVNVSGVQLQHPEFLEVVRRALADTGARAQRFELELTEGFMIEASATILNVLQELKAMGFTLAVDDFGTGHASFGYLRDLPIDKIKIDQTFVRQMVIESHDASIIRAIIALGKGLNVDVVAEGIESNAQLNFLRDEGCRTGQGYLFSLPLTAEDFGFLLDRAVKLPSASSRSKPVALTEEVA